MKYSYHIRGFETRHHDPHIHLNISDGRDMVVFLHDFSYDFGKLSSKELKQLKSDLEPIIDDLINEFYDKNPDKKYKNEKK